MIWAILFIWALIDMRLSDRLWLRQLERQNDLVKVAAEDWYTLCPMCDNGGWVSVWSEHPPAFKECEVCFNPDDLPCP